LTAARTSFLPPGSSCSSTISSSGTNPSDAKTVRRSGLRFWEPQTRGITVPREPRRERCVRFAARKPRCRSGRRRDVRCYAGNVSSRGGRRRRRDLKLSFPRDHLQGVELLAILRQAGYRNRGKSLFGSDTVQKRHELAPMTANTFTFPESFILNP